jgi:hypothetical protein
MICPLCDGVGEVEKQSVIFNPNEGVRTEGTGFTVPCPECAT